MKRVLFWKWVDLVGQVLMALPVVCLVFSAGDGFSVLPYFTVVGWQALSCLLHALFNRRVQSKSRRYYTRSLA
jgi:hypothetical protein